MRLGVIARMWIVLSMFWVIGGTLYFASDQRRIDNGASIKIYEGCIAISVKHNTSSDTCQVDRDNDLERYRQRQWSYLIGGFSSAAIIWLAASILWGLIYVSVRWIWAGRQ